MSGWQSTAPTQPGRYWMRCNETDNDRELVDVRYMNGRRMELWAVNCAIGSLPVADYHNGLTDCQWLPYEGSTT